MGLKTLWKTQRLLSHIRGDAASRSMTQFCYLLFLRINWRLTSTTIAYLAEIYWRNTMDKFTHLLLILLKFQNMAITNIMHATKHISNHILSQSKATRHSNTDSGCSDLRSDTEHALGNWNHCWKMVCKNYILSQKRHLFQYALERSLTYRILSHIEIHAHTTPQSKQTVKTAQLQCK